MVERRHLVYVLPGIGGSVLSQSTPDGDYDPVWDAGFADIAALLFKPGRMSVTEREHLVPTGLIRSKQLLPGWRVVPGYERLERSLCALPGVRLDDGHPARRVANANVVLFPYDFRRSVVEAAQRLDADVHTRLEELGGDGAGHVVVVAHSLGGLVARYWAGPLGGWRLCRALVTLGTPHRGAPKALDTVANGVPVGVERLGRPARMLAGWASVAELMPAYRAVRDAGTGTWRYPHELPPEAVAGPARAGYAVHREINEAWGSQVPRRGPEVRSYFGFSHGTLRSAVWDGTKLRAETEAPGGVDLTGWESDLGDGTVPAFCAVPVESSGSDVRDVRMPERHGPLGVSDVVPRLLEFYEGRADIGAIQGAGAATVPAAFGVDVGELHPAGEAVPVRVRVCGADRVPETTAVWVQVHPADRRGPRAAEVRAVWNAAEGVFAAEVPGLGPGLYDLSVTARAVPGVGELRCVDAFGVVEP